jgi:hypothetical protein
MTSDWTPVFVLPNIPLETAIGCDIAALAPPHDRRVASLKAAHPMFRRFLNRFADNFGAKFEPSVLLLDGATPPVFREVGTLAAFRDLIAIATVCRGRALDLRYPRGHRILFGEPALFRTQLGDSDVDQPLLATLMERWRRRYETSEPGQAGAMADKLKRTGGVALFECVLDLNGFSVGAKPYESIAEAMQS